MLLIDTVNVQDFIKNIGNNGVFKMYEYPPQKTSFVPRCEACGCHKNTVPVKFYGPANDHLLHLCIGCYEALW